MSQTVSGFARALAALGEAGVEFVVVGVGGINFYARTPADAFATLDIDALLAPTSENEGSDTPSVRSSATVRTCPNDSLGPETALPW